MNGNRISKNEERLDCVNDSIRKMEEALIEFRSNMKKIKLLNSYYGSRAWFQDKEDYEKKRITSVKAGVLSEDAVWNMNEKLNELFNELDYIKKHIH